MLEASEADWLDRKRLEEITGGDETLARELIDLFAIDLPSMAERLIAAARRAPAEGGARLVAAGHEVKGAAGNLGLKRLADASAALEAAAKRGDVTGLEPLVKAFEAARAEFVQQWETHRDQKLL